MPRYVTYLVPRAIQNDRNFVTTAWPRKLFSWKITIPEQDLQVHFQITTYIKFRGGSRIFSREGGGGGGGGGVVGFSKKFRKIWRPFF